MAGGCPPQVRLHNPGPLRAKKTRRGGGSAVPRRGDTGELEADVAQLIRHSVREKFHQRDPDKLKSRRIIVDAFFTVREKAGDADLGGLGTDGFPEQSQRFRRELEQGGRSFTDLEFWRTEAAFLNGVNYFSEAARRLRGPGLERNRARVAAEVRRLSECRGK